MICMMRNFKLNFENYRLKFYPLLTSEVIIIRVSNYNSFFREQSLWAVIKKVVKK